MTYFFCLEAGGGDGDTVTLLHRMTPAPERLLSAMMNLTGLSEVASVVFKTSLILQIESRNVTCLNPSSVPSCSNFFLYSLCIQGHAKQRIRRTFYN